MNKKYDTDEERLAAVKIRYANKTCPSGHNNWRFAIKKGLNTHRFAAATCRVCNNICKPESKLYRKNSVQKRIYKQISELADGYLAGQIRKLCFNTTKVKISGKSIPQNLKNTLKMVIQLQRQFNF